MWKDWIMKEKREIEILIGFIQCNFSYSHLSLFFFPGRKSCGNLKGLLELHKSFLGGKIWIEKKIIGEYCHEILNEEMFIERNWCPLNWIYFRYLGILIWELLRYFPINAHILLPSYCMEKNCHRLLILTLEAFSLSHHPTSN